MRTELRKRGIKHLKVVYSKEKAITPVDDMAISCSQHCICPPGTARKCTQRRQVPGSTAYVPAVAGLIIVEPDLLGGVRVELGTEVIEGTVAGRLAEARKLFA